MNDDIFEFDFDGGLWCDDELYDYECVISFLINNVLLISSLFRFLMECNICGEDMEVVCSELIDYC